MYLQVSLNIEIARKFIFYWNNIEDREIFLKWVGEWYFVQILLANRTLRKAWFQKAKNLCQRYSHIPYHVIQNDAQLHQFCHYIHLQFIFVFPLRNHTIFFFIQHWTHAVRFFVWILKRAVVIVIKSFWNLISNRKKNLYLHISLYVWRNFSMTFYYRKIFWINDY